MRGRDSRIGDRAHFFISMERDGMGGMLVVLEVLLVASSHADVVTLPPLAGDEREALATAIDDRDHQESAFATLVAAMGRVEVDRLDVASLEQWSPERMRRAVDEPDAERGAPALIMGRLEQSTELPRPWSGQSEWFVRMPGGEAIAVYVPLDEAFTDGSRVRVVGRFYKRVRAVARDGVERFYPAFVGRVVPTSFASDPTYLFVLLVVVLLLGWGMLQFFLRRARTPHSGRRIPRDVEPEVTPTEPDLPSNTIDALDELARRGDDRT